jgi:colanic acid/amylovoran biosynthesis glycosyltransferase
LTPLVAIATRDYEKYSETFVRRHVDGLFGGNTAVIAFSPPTSELAKPFFLATPLEKPDRSDGGIRIGRSWRRNLRNAAHGRDLNRFLRRAGATHLLCEFGYVATELVDAITRAPVPVFCYFRGSDATKKLADPAYVTALKKVTPHLAGRIAVSRFLVDRLERAGIFHENTAIIPSGTDTERIRPAPSEELHIVTIGRLVGKKDPLTALSAFARVAAASRR